MSTKPSLLSNASATGSAKQWAGGRGLFSVEGTFDGATVQLQYAGPNGTLTNVQGTALTAAGQVVVELPPGEVKATVSGGSSPSGLYATLQKFRLEAG